MYLDDVKTVNLGLKCCGIVYANVMIGELEGIVNKLLRNENVHRVNCDCIAEDYNLQFTVIADDYSQLQEIIESQCNFDIKFRYGYFSILSAWTRIVAQTNWQMRVIISSFKH